MKTRTLILFGALLALSVFLYRDYRNSKTVNEKRMREEFYQREIAQLQSASPRRAAVAAAAHGNNKFYIVQGEFHSSIPGITNGYSLKRIYDQKQYQVIYYATDVMRRPQSDYHQVAWRYAASYNRALEQLILTNLPSTALEK
ncbi:MAG TPA: hypothetical protein VGH19_09175 [Verrucomicrobiae bacterium]